MLTVFPLENSNTLECCRHIQGKYTANLWLLLHGGFTGQSQQWDQQQTKAAWMWSIGADRGREDASLFVLCFYSCMRSVYTQYNRIWFDGDLHRQHIHTRMHAHLHAHTLDCANAEWKVITSYKIMLRSSGVVPCQITQWVEPSRFGS